MPHENLANKAIIDNRWRATYSLSNVSLIVVLIVSTKLSSASVTASFLFSTFAVIGDSILLKGISSPRSVSNVTYKAVYMCV